jgi:hypothetical protein
MLDLCILVREAHGEITIALGYRPSGVDPELLPWLDIFDEGDVAGETGGLRATLNLATWSEDLPDRIVAFFGQRRWTLCPDSRPSNRFPYVTSWRARPAPSFPRLRARTTPREEGVRLLAPSRPLQRR